MDDSRQELNDLRIEKENWERKAKQWRAHNRVLIHKHQELVSDLSDWWDMSNEGTNDDGMEHFRKLMEHHKISPVSLYDKYPGLWQHLKNNRPEEPGDHGDGECCRK